jgi:hypothetical protein
MPGQAPGSTANSPHVSVSAAATPITNPHGSVIRSFAAAWGAEATDARCRRAAQVAVATADGHALHAVSSRGALSADELAAALELLLDALRPG